MLVQVYLKRGCLVPMHAHDSEQMTYVLQGALKFLVGGRRDHGARRGSPAHRVRRSSISPKRSRTRSSSTLFSAIRHDLAAADDELARNHLGDLRERQLVPAMTRNASQLRRFVSAPAVPVVARPPDSTSNFLRRG